MLLERPLLYLTYLMYVYMAVSRVKATSLVHQYLKCNGKFKHSENDAIMK